MGERDDSPVSRARWADTLTRRDFCTRSCWSALALTASGAIGTLSAACGGGSSTGPSANLPLLPVVTGTAANNAVSATVDASSPLAPVGSAALVQSSATPVLVVHSADTAFAAFIATCTHEACTITGFANNRFVCPCHGSQFDTGGSVVSGPAVRSLSKLNVQLSGNTLTVS